MQGRTNSTSVYSKNVDVTFTENGIYVPSEDYTGFGVVTVDTPTVEDIVMQEDYYILPTKVDFTNPEVYQYDNYQSPYIDTQGKSYAGVDKIKVRRIGSWIDAEINTDNIKKGHTILGVTGNVIEVNNQANKTTKSSGSTVYVRPDSGYTGLSQVTVQPIQVQTKSTTFNQTASTSYPMTRSVYMDSGYDGMTRVDITVNAPPPCPTYVTTDLQIRPSIEQQIFRPSSYNADGFGTLTVEPVTSAIDSNIQPPNIAPGVTILGVTGTYKPQHLQNKVVEPNTIQDQVITADSEYEALGEVTVKKVTAAIDSDIQSGNIREGVDILGVTGTYHGPDYNIETVTGVTPLTTAQTVTPSEGYDYLDSVTIKGVTAAIDQNIQANNIKEGVTILGVEGTFATQTVKTQALKTVSPTTTEQHVFADTGYDAIVELVVRAVTAGIDPNIIAENIKKNITILGVRGTLDATQKWFDFQDLAGFTVLTSDTFGSGQFSPELTAEVSDYVITSCLISSYSDPVDVSSAGIFTTVFGYDSLQSTDPIIYQTYIAFNGGYYYDDYSVYITIPDQISYLYPVINTDDINGCLLNCEDTGLEKTYHVYIITGIKDVKPVLVDGTINVSMLPEGYTDYRHVGTITIPAHNVFKPIKAPTANVASNTQKVLYTIPKLSANGTIGGNSFAVNQSSYIDSTRVAWRAFDQSNTSGELDCWHSVLNESPAWIEWYIPTEVYIDTISITNRVSAEGYNAFSPKNYQVQISSDGIIWTTIYSGTNTNDALGSTWQIDLTSVENKKSKYWRLYVTSNNGNEVYTVIGEITLDAYTVINTTATKWNQPDIYSATTYGTITWGDIATGSDEGWKVFSPTTSVNLTDYNYTTENNIATINEYIGSSNDLVLADVTVSTNNFIPELTGSFIKWTMPSGIRLALTKEGTTVTIKHAADSNLMSGTPFRLYADEAKTIPLTSAFADPGIEGAITTIPIIKDFPTNTLYLDIAEHENYGGISEIIFNNVYLSRAGTSAYTQSWLLDNSIKPATNNNVLYNEGTDVNVLENNITFYTQAPTNQPLRVYISAYDLDRGQPNIINQYTQTVANVTANGSLSITNGEVSGFSTSNYAVSEQVLKNNLEITLRAICRYRNDSNGNACQYLVSDITGSGFGIRDHSNRYFRITDISQNTDSGSSTFDNNTWQWIKFVQTGTTATLYAFRDTGTYTSVDNLPPVSDTTWVSKCSRSTPIFKGNKLIIGNRPSNATGYNQSWYSSIDFSNFKIDFGNNYTWRPYSLKTNYISNHNVVPRVTYTNLRFITEEDVPPQYYYWVNVFGYIDDGSAVTMNVYAVYDNMYGRKSYVFAPDDSVELKTQTDSSRLIKLGFVGTVDIPEHTVYVYDINQGWVPKV